VVQLLGGVLVASALAGCELGSTGSSVAALQEPVHFASLLDVGALIEARDLSPVELTAQILARVEALDGDLHSYLTVLADDAMAAASRAEQEISAGDYKGPLHGIPFAVKDLCYTQGVPTTGGLAVLADFVPEYDATVVERLKAGGAVILGKLNLTEGAMAGYHRDFQIPVNPWDASLAVGGSSSGSGVATAAGLCFGAIGTDTGGSIRFPSAANGIVGLKPTYGRVSRHGILALAESLDHVGPMARYVSDAAAMFTVMAGADPNDPTSLAEPVPNILSVLDGEVRALRVGFDVDYATRDIDAGLVASIEQAIPVLESLGIEVVEVTMPAFTPDHFNMWIALCSFEAVRAHSQTYPSRADEYGEFFRVFLEAGATITSDVYQALSEQRAAYSAGFVTALADVDAVLCPAGHVPSPADTEARYGAGRSIEEASANPNFRFTFPANFAGTPTITVPCGTRADGAPYALQFMGSRLSEPVLCRIAYAYEQAASWHRNHPVV
jgi:amidase